MTLEKTVINGNDVVAVKGRIDASTVPEFESTILGLIKTGSTLIINCEKLDYVSSAGLRAFLMAHKTSLKENAKVIIKSPTEAVMEVFDMTGFSSILNIED